MQMAILYTDPLHLSRNQTGSVVQCGSSSGLIAHSVMKRIKGKDGLSVCVKFY